MKRLILLVIGLLSATPALADSYSVGLSAGGPGKTSSTSFAGFNSALGTLTRVDISLSGSTIYDITLPEPSPGSPPPSGTVSYNLKDGLFLYAQSSLGILAPQPYLQQTGIGTAPVLFGNFQATTSGLDGLTSFTDADALATFLDTGFSGDIAVDDPFSASLTVNGSPTGLFGATIGIAAKSVTGSVTYTYSPIRSAVPEPASWATMVIGLGLIGGAARRRVRAMRTA